MSSPFPHMQVRELSEHLSALAGQSAGSLHSKSTLKNYRTRGKKLSLFAESKTYGSNLADILQQTQPEEYGNWLADMGISPTPYIDTAAKMYSTLHTAVGSWGSSARAAEWNRQRERRMRDTARAPKRDRTALAVDLDDDSMTNTADGIRPKTQRLRDIAQYYARDGLDLAGFAYMSIQAYGPPLRNADFNELKVNPVVGSVDISLGNHMWVDEMADVHIYLNKHKTANSIGDRHLKLAKAQSAQVIRSLYYNMPIIQGQPRFRPYYVQTKDYKPVKNMTNVINLLKCGFTDAADVRLYGCNTFRRNFADALISKQLEADMAIFADVCTRITKETKQIFNAGLAMGSSGGVLLTEYRKSEISWTVDSKLAIQLLLTRAHGGVNLD
jgi:hypothetical protein